MNMELKRKIVYIDEMANILLKQMKEIQKEIVELEVYPKDELVENIDLMEEIDNKLYSVARIINCEEVE